MKPDALARTCFPPAAGLAIADRTFYIRVEK